MQFYRCVSSGLVDNKSASRTRRDSFDGRVNESQLTIQNVSSFAGWWDILTFYWEWMHTHTHIYIYVYMYICMCVIKGVGRSDVPQVFVSQSLLREKSLSTSGITPLSASIFNTNTNYYDMEWVGHNELNPFQTETHHALWWISIGINVTVYTLSVAYHGIAWLNHGQLPRHNSLCVMMCNRGNKIDGGLITWLCVMVSRERYHLEPLLLSWIIFNPSMDL